MKEKYIVVIGSMNYDVLFKQQRLPMKGETYTADSVSFCGGGKGANQAVQCEIDNGIASLKKKYQGNVDSEGRYHEGASTLISRAKSETQVLKRKELPFMKHWKNSGNSVSYHSMCRGISGAVAILN